MLRRRSSLDLEAGPPPERTAWFITAVVLAGAFGVAFTITILSVSRPEIARDLDTDASTLVWVISGPIIAAALVSATAGKLGDLRGHRLMYLFGTGGAAVFALASAFAWDAGSLIAFRVVGALVGAATGPSSMAIINMLFPPERRSAALGYWSLVVAGGPVLGLVLGGPLVDAFGWRMIFVLQAPLLALATLAAFLVVPETPTRPEARFDVLGQVLLSVGLFSLLVGLDRGRPWGWADQRVVVLLVVAVVALVAFVFAEFRAEEPLLPMGNFRRRAYAAPIVVQLLLNFGYMGGFILAPKLLDEVRGLTPGTISLMLVPRPLTFAILGPLAGLAVVRYGPRLFSTAGSVSITASLAILAMVAGNPTTAAVVVAIALSGLGMGLAQPALASSVANAVDRRDLGVAGASQQLAAQVGAALGMNLLESIQVARLDSTDVPGSFATAYTVGFGVSAVAVVVALFIPRHAPGGAPERPARDEDFDEEYEEEEEVRARLAKLT